MHWWAKPWTLWLAKTETAPLPSLSLDRNTRALESTSRGKLLISHPTKRPRLLTRLSSVLALFLANKGLSSPSSTLFISRRIWLTLSC